MWLWLWLWLLCNVKKHCHPCCLAIGVVVVARLGKPFQIPFQGKAIKKKKQCTSRLQLNRNAHFFAKDLYKLKVKNTESHSTNIIPYTFLMLDFSHFSSTSLRVFLHRLRRLSLLATFLFLNELTLAKGK